MELPKWPTQELSLSRQTVFGVAELAEPRIEPVIASCLWSDRIGRSRSKGSGPRLEDRHAPAIVWASHHHAPPTWKHNLETTYVPPSLNSPNITHQTKRKKCTRAFWSVIAFATSFQNGGHSLMGLPEILGNTYRRQSPCGSFAEVYLHQSGTTLCICGDPGFRESVPGNWNIREFVRLHPQDWVTSTLDHTQDPPGPGCPRTGWWGPACSCLY